MIRIHCYFYSSRNVKKISVKPIHSLEEFSSQSDGDEYSDSEEEGEAMMEAMKRSMDEARQKQKEQEEEIEADHASAMTSRSKRGKSTSKKSNAKKLKQ